VHDLTGSRVRELRKRGSERGGGQLQYGRNIVAPSGNQTANGEHQPRPIASGETRLLARTQVADMG
jgi:hypothetical protein